MYYTQTKLYYDIIFWAIGIKTFRKHAKRSKFVCIKFDPQFMHNLCLFVEIQRYLEIPPIDFCETWHYKRQAPKV